MIHGTPDLTLTGPQGRVSLNATAGHQRAIQLSIRNAGTASAKNVSLSATDPNNWKVVYKPNSLPDLAAGQSSKVEALVTPAPKALAGDYMVTLRANSGSNISASQDFRVTVHTSTLWGIIAVLIIAAALMVAVLAIRRYGRR